MNFLEFLPIILSREEVHLSIHPLYLFVLQSLGEAVYTLDSSL